MTIAKRAAYVGVVTLVLAAMVAVVGPRLFGWHVEPVLSSSMEPTFAAGDIVVVAPIDPSEVMIDDIIMYRTGSNPPFITHRVVGIEGLGNDMQFTMKGDATGAADDPVFPEAIAGRMSYSIPFLGHIAAAMTTPAGLLVAGSLSLLILVGPSAYQTFRGTNEQDDDACVSSPS